MGGNAFHHLECPRMLPDVYAAVKASAAVALHKVFTHVTVPLEVPGKVDYGDVDFLVSAPFGNTSELNFTSFPFESVIKAVKQALDTPHGRQGQLTPTCLYFAIPLPLLPTTTLSSGSGGGDEEPQLWAQIDAKICFKPASFSWRTFELNYATQSSIFGSMIKPLGLTLDYEGLHIRVEDIETTDRARSMVFVSRDPWTVCKVLGMGRRAVDGGFDSTQQLFEEYTASWICHPEHLKAKLEEDSYLLQHSHRAYFWKTWVPERFPDFKFNDARDDDGGLEAWTNRTRVVAREKVFTMLPHVATSYFTKRADYLKEVKENRLRDQITGAIPAGTDGWSDEFELPAIIIKDPGISEGRPTKDYIEAAAQCGEPTPPPSPKVRSTGPGAIESALNSPPSGPSSTILYIEALPRQPPYSCKPSRPPQSMSAPARLACLARWTAFTATGIPYLRTSPHPKDYDLQWRDAVEAGLPERELLKWAQDVWWVVWLRQCVVNWRGMWAKRFEKEDRKAEKLRADSAEKQVLEVEARMEAELKSKAEEDLVASMRAKVMARLERMNRVLGLGDEEK